MSALVTIEHTIRKEAGVLRSAGNLATRLATGTYGRRIGTGVLGGAGAGALGDSDNRVRGALVGAGLGGAGMSGAVLATKAGRRAGRKSISNIGTKTRYLVTGGGLGKTNAEKIRRAEEMGIVSKLPVAKKGLSERKLRAARKTRAAEIKAVRAGYLTVPGVAKGMVTRPGQTLKNAWARQGLLGKGFVGMGAYDVGSQALTATTPGGPSRLSRVGSALGDTAGWALMPSGMAGGMLASSGLGYAGGKAGNLVGRVLPKRNPVPATAARAS